LAFLEGTQNAEKYIDTLGNYLFPFGHANYGPTFTFMQDGASIHRAKVTEEFLKGQNIDLFAHPALSPDLNPIENLWGVLARKVYGNGKQYPNVKELIAAVKEAWSQIDHNYIQKLIDSMPSRCVDVIQAKGAKIDY
ncbi:hypothetical protein As57867_004498, partial [Aphanomyces stellatus]